MTMLLTRDQFRERVFARDRHICVVPGCGQKAQDAHHIIERRLWTAPGEEEGYFLDNGASLCEFHHRYGAETCAIQADVLRQWIGLDPGNLLDTRYPKGWDELEEYDKWGVKLRRPSDLRLFPKYQSTPYLPMSPGNDPNDINLTDLKPFLNQPLVFTVKMDGSNTMLTNHHVAARNGSRAEHPSYDWLKGWHAANKQLIPTGIQVFGENMYAKHSIYYGTGERGEPVYGEPGPLESYFYVFGVYGGRTNIFAGWNDIVAMATRLGFPVVPVASASGPRGYTDEWELYRDIENTAKAVISTGHEGIVVRTMYPFHCANFEGYETENSNDHRRWKVNAIAKYVRENHVQTDEHWIHKPIVRNELMK